MFWAVEWRCGQRMRDAQLTIQAGCTHHLVGQYLVFVAGARLGGVVPSSLVRQLLGRAGQGMGRGCPMRASCSVYSATATSETSTAQPAPTWLLLSLFVAARCSSLRLASNWARALGTLCGSPSASSTASDALAEFQGAGRESMAEANPGAQCSLLLPLTSACTRDPLHQRLPSHAHRVATADSLAPTDAAAAPRPAPLLPLPAICFTCEESTAAQCCGSLVGASKEPDQSTSAGWPRRQQQAC